MNRAAVTLAGALLLVALGAGPALAHTRASSATNFDSRIEQAPDLPGVGWRLYPGGEYLEVTNTGPVPLVVLGYEGEPYLRVGPDGVARNRNSPATYLNGERYADVAVPPRADPDASPDWERLSEAPRYAWHDHRTHWMSPALPPGVAADPGAGRTVNSWVVPFVHGDRAQEVAGSLTWDPGPPWWPWVVAALVLTAPAATGLRGRGPVSPRPAALTLAAVALVNLAHLPDEVASLPLPALDVAFGVLHNLLFITAGLAGAFLAWRGTGSLAALGIGAGAVAFHQGLLQVSQLGASQLATIWPPAVIRMLVALSLAQAVWVAILTVRAGRAPHATAERPGTAAPAGREPAAVLSDVSSGPPADR